MKIVFVKFKRGVRRKIKETQKEYCYLCPIDDIEKGEYVIIDVHKNNRQEFFCVGQVQNVLEETEELLLQLQPTGFVFSKVPVKDFERRCKIIHKKRFRLMAKYKEYNENEKL